MGSHAPLDDVLITAELARRPPRAPDFRAEAEALATLAQTMVRAPERIFQELVEAAVRLGGSGSGGISLLDEEAGAAVFRWRATAGAFASLAGTTLPRHFSPCGVVLDTNARQLMVDPVRHYPYLAVLSRPVHEVLLVPFHDGDLPIGTLWLASHEPARRFDGEDARILTNLAHFAAAAWQAAGERRDSLANEIRLADTLREGARSQSELVSVQKQARLTEATFREYFDHLPFYSGILSLDGRVTEVSRLASEGCGYPRDLLIGKCFWEAAWWRTSGEVQTVVRDAVTTALAGQPYQAVLPYVRADGSERRVDISLSPGRDDEGAVAFVIVTGTDITDRQSAEAELAAVRKRLDSALIAGEVGTYEWDVVADRLYGDRNFERIFGVPLDVTGEAPLNRFVDAIHVEDRHGVIAQINHSVATGADYEADYRVMSPQGERWITARGRMTRNAAGRVVSFSGVVLDNTRRKRAEQERAVIAERYRRLSAIHETVLSATNDFAYVFDLDGRFLYANRPLLALYARTLDQLVGRSFYDLGYPTWHADRHMQEIAQVVATRQPVRGEVAFTGESGASGIYDYIFTPVLDERGEVELVAGTTRDVTERRRTEDRDRLLVALDDATRPLTDADAITQVSARLLGDHLQVNRCAYADVEEDENTFNLTGDYNRGVTSIVGRYRFDQFGAECLRLMRAGKPYVVVDSAQDPRTEGVRAAYAQTGIGAVICVPMLKSGRLVAAMAVHQAGPRQWRSEEVELMQRVASRCWESIERTRVMRALAKSEEQLRLAVETGRFGIWEIELPAWNLTCSGQCRKQYGRAENEPFGYDDWRHAMHPHDGERVLAGLARAIEERRVYDSEYRTRWPDGSVHWVLVRAQATYDPHGRPLRMTGVSLEITARKEAEREQIRLREEADRASRAKDDFLAALSHELRTPLNPVLLIASDAVQDPGLPAATRTLFETIRKNVELEARLIDDLLDLTGIARGKLAIRTQREHLHDVLTDAVATVKGEFEQAQVALEIALAADDDIVAADAVRLLQVFLNLLKNAVKFTPAGGRVTLRTARAGEGRIEIEISDTGMGMTPAELERAFRAFEQGDHAGGVGSRLFGGLGLGLAISRRLVEMHGGTITACSAGRDQGSCFRVELPLHAAAQPAESGATAPVRAMPAGKRSPATLRILLVEDHEPTRRTLEQLLRRRKYPVKAVGSLQEARRAAEEELFDLLVSDLGLPDGDGADLMAELRARHGLTGLALTGYGMEQDVERCRQAGFLTHLTKPIRVESLESALAAAAEALGAAPASETR